MTCRCLMDAANVLSFHDSLVVHYHLHSVSRTRSTLTRMILSGTEFTCRQCLHVVMCYMVKKYFSVSIPENSCLLSFPLLLHQKTEWMTTTCPHTLMCIVDVFSQYFDVLAPVLLDNLYSQFSWSAQQGEHTVSLLHCSTCT